MEINQSVVIINVFWLIRLISNNHYISRIFEYILLIFRMRGPFKVFLLKQRDNYALNAEKPEAVSLPVTVKKMFLENLSCQGTSTIQLNKVLKAGVEKDILKCVITCPILVLHY